MSSSPRYIKLLILLLYTIVFTEVLIPHHHHSGENNQSPRQHCEKSFHFEEPQLQTHFNTLALFTKKMLEFFALPPSADCYTFRDDIMLTWRYAPLYVSNDTHRPIFGISLRAPPAC